MDQHPELNDAVVLRDVTGREYVSRVEELGTGLVVVIRPHDLPDDAPVAGAAVSIIWADANSDATVLPTRLLAAHAKGPLDLWSLAVTGPANTEQRRKHDRVAVSGSVTLRRANGDGVPGSLVDVSEGGVRCRVEAGAADVFLGGSNEVVAEFGLGSAEFEIAGHAEFLRATSSPAEFEDLVVVFGEPVEQLREQVAAELKRDAD